MQKRISDLNGHYIVCGLGDTGRHVLEELNKTGTPYIIVEIDEARISRVRENRPDLSNMLFIIGDATEEDTLDKAGLQRAHGLITALPADKDNLVVTVVAHHRCPTLRIVARSTDQRFSERMLRAGAKATVSPSHIGGLRMASEAIRPHVVGFLDLMLKQSHTLRVEEIEVGTASPWAGNTLGELKIHSKHNLLVLAVKNEGDIASSKLWVNPPQNLVLKGGTAIIVMGDVKDIRQARHEARSAQMTG